jgi:hypothetical protein
VGSKDLFKGFPMIYAGFGDENSFNVDFSPFKVKKNTFLMWAMTKQYLHMHSTWLESAICLES